MTLTHVTVILRTNVPPESIQKEFLSKMTTFISNLFGAETGNVVVELHTNIQMMRAGSTSPMINMNVHHNSDKVATAKVELAGSIAQFLSREISMPFDSLNNYIRILLKNGKAAEVDNIPAELINNGDSNKPTVNR